MKKSIKFVLMLCLFVLIYIPFSGNYTVTITLPGGDEYCGEFEITE